MYNQPMTLLTRITYQGLIRNCFQHYRKKIPMAYIGYYGRMKYRPLSNSQSQNSHADIYLIIH